MGALLKYEDVYDEEGNPVFDEQVTEEIQELAEIVYNNHYTYKKGYDREDLIMEGIRKGIEMIKSGRYNPDYGAPLRNFIYTGMRNEMTNYLYSKKKEYPVEEFYGDQKIAPEIYVDTYEVSFNDIEDICRVFRRRWGDYKKLLIDSLEDMGFEIEDVDNDDLEEREDYDKKVLERMVVLAVWRIQEYYL